MGDWFRRMTELENDTDDVVVIKSTYGVESRLLPHQRKCIPATRYHDRSVYSGRCIDIKAVIEGELEGLTLSANDFRFNTKISFRIEDGQLAVEKVPTDQSWSTEIGRIKLLKTLWRRLIPIELEIGHGDLDQQVENLLPVGHA